MERVSLVEKGVECGSFVEGSLMGVSAGGGAGRGW